MALGAAGELRWRCPGAVAGALFAAGGAGLVRGPQKAPAGGQYLLPPPDYRRGHCCQAGAAGGAAHRRPGNHAEKGQIPAGVQPSERDGPGDSHWQLCQQPAGLYHQAGK